MTRTALVLAAVLALSSCTDDAAPVSTERPSRVHVFEPEIVVARPTNVPERVIVMDAVEIVVER